jgi:hypothetical protein
VPGEAEPSVHGDDQPDPQVGRVRIADTMNRGRPALRLRTNNVGASPLLPRRRRTPGIQNRFLRSAPSQPGSRADRAQRRRPPPQRALLDRARWLLRRLQGALWPQTDSLRLELQPRGIAVTGLHVGYADTDLAADVDAPKSDPRDVAALALDGIETGAYEVLADDIARQVKAGQADDLADPYAQLAK